MAPWKSSNAISPSRPRGLVRIKVQACGICHSDSLTKEGLCPGIQYPRVPGHEVAGVIDAVGAGVAGWTPASGSASAGTADTAATAILAAAATSSPASRGQVTGITYDGGYADYMIAPPSALALIPEELSAVEAGPLMCAGITTFNALRNSGARPGDLVAVLGVGGLGHLGVQFAAKMGFRTVAIARGEDKEPLAKNLALALHRQPGAGPRGGTAQAGRRQGHPRHRDQRRGDERGAGRPGVNGTLIVLGAPPIRWKCRPALLIGGRRSIKGWSSGTSIDSQDTLAFSALTGVRSMNEVFPLERAAEAYERMMSGKARFRVVLTMAR